MPSIAPLALVQFGHAARAALPALLWLAVSAVPPLACAADPAAPAEAPAPAVVPGSVSPPDAKPSGGPDERASALAQRYGYTLVERNGETLFCKEQRVTASRVKKHRRCVTEDQMELEATTAQELLDKVNKGHTPRAP